MPEAAWRGRCLCGAVRWRSAKPPRWTAHCHCESCRRQSGGGVVTWLGMRRRSFSWTGEAPRSFESAPGVVRRFCGTCGTPVSYESERWADEVHVYAAHAEDQGAVAPSMHVHWAERVAWLDFADDLPRHDGEAGGG